MGKFININNSRELLGDLISDALNQGADAADAIWVKNTSTTTTCRMGKLEKLNDSDEEQLGLRVFIGKRQSIVSSSDCSPKAFKEIIDKSLMMAKTLPEDPFVGIADKADLVTNIPDIDTFDKKNISTDELIDSAMSCEDSARSVSGITNSEGASAGWGKSSISLVASNGFNRSYQSSGGSLSVSVLAGQNSSGMEVDYDYSTSVYWEDLKDPEKIGRSAANRAKKRLGAKKIKSGKFPVIYEPRVARGILGHFITAINGNLVSKDTSFLRDKMGKQIFNKEISVIEDPHRKRGLRSKSCDSEGIQNKKRDLIEAGILKTWLLDLYSSRKLSLRPTGHASRGVASQPSPSVTNVYLDRGTLTPAKLISGIKSGLYVTDTFGQGVNYITGNYSRGIAGFWIDKGEIAFPVNEITIAGNLKDMFKNLIPANDLELSYGIDSPTIMIESMSIAGS
ncbi:MAG: modulator protein [Alphaproteobacteria bacterium TMED87]|nr:modulator protein [Rhodospirillaceae bacterium]OUV10959.1 MAG: modulator protein [Alphaproteobacteria bacterium TMED87]